MNPKSICQCLRDAGYDAVLTDGASRLRATIEIGGRPMTLVHHFPRELIRVPTFSLEGGHGFGPLAHVHSDGDGHGGEICIGDVESTAVNIECPEQAYKATIGEHVRLLERLTADSEHNQAELLREFDAHWSILCDTSNSAPSELFVAWDGETTEGLQLRQPRSTLGADLRTRSIGLAHSVANQQQLQSVLRYAGWETRQVSGRAVAVRLTYLPPPPTTRTELLSWYFLAIRHADAKGTHELKRLSKKRKPVYWLVFSAPIPDGVAMFAIRWCKRKPGRLPLSANEARPWAVAPYRVRPLSRPFLVPRGGGSLRLGEKNVLLVGCGSVGSELALRLTSVGVGGLTLSDPDKLSEKNLYRHALSAQHIGRLKTEALAGEISLRHPWARVTYWRRRLEDLRDAAMLQTFDLVVIAIGSPTVERVFSQYCRESAIDAPVINCWLEGYGIGGHAILALPSTRGCWLCAYVDPVTLTRGLASNLNFVAPGQVAMRNQGGCGAPFLPYSGIASSYTASVAADLAVRLLTGELTTSSKVSWKGSDVAAKRAALDVTWRYRHFGQSLQILPLYNDSCDICGS